MSLPVPHLGVVDNSRKSLGVVENRNSDEHFSAYLSL